MLLKVGELREQTFRMTKVAGESYVAKVTPLPMMDKRRSVNVAATYERGVGGPRDYHWSAETGAF